MTVLDCGSVTLGVDDAGSGPTIVLIHGAWSDRGTWDPVFALFAERFRTIRYDRRGYGESQRPGVHPSGHVEDLLALLRTLALDEVTLIGNSLGALIAMHAALRDRDAIKMVIAHEPPMLRLLESESANNPQAARALGALYRALDAARDGDHASAARHYVDGMASYPGAWAYLPEIVRQGFIENAEAFLADSSDLQEFDLDARQLERLGASLVVTLGDRTSPYMKLIIERLYRELPEMRRHAFATGGHVPHQSSPAEFVANTCELVTNAPAYP